MRCVLYFLFLIITVTESAGKFSFGDAVEVLVSSVHPYYNPGEKYNYDWLPWPCHPREIHEKAQELGSSFIGERSRESLYKIEFRRPVENGKLCDPHELSKDDITKFQTAIQRHFEYEMFVDDLPVYYQVGYYRKPHANDPNPKFYLFTHREFHILYNGDRIIAVNITRNVGIPVNLIAGEPQQVTFTYSVKWSRTNHPFDKRAIIHAHAQPTRRQMEAHWLWVLNSSLLVILLTGLLSMILLRTLKNDIARYLQLDEIDQVEAAEARKEGTFEEIDDSGWKRIRFDVFRPPLYPMIFSSIIGVGAQVLMISTFLLLLAVVGYFYPGNHGRLYVASIILYSITAYVAGYVSSKKFKEFGGEDWMISCVLTSTLFAVPMLIVFSIVNSIAISYGSSAALPFSTILAIILMWAFVTFPLTLYGSYKGAFADKIDYPCRVKYIPRSLPSDLPWYYNPFVQTIVAGFLPFIAIYVEVHTLFMSVWGHQVYTLFGILLLTFVILLIVTAFVVILLCYFQLTSEDYRWWWASLLRGGACGAFLYAYAIFYWVYNSEMDGALQGTMYFGYTLMVTYAFSLMLAAVGHWASYWFVYTIYNAIHAD